MAVKRIILRGISHTPSDQRVDDGGCAESLNVQLREGELTPMLQPQDITSELLPEGVESGAAPYIPIFIHKTNTYTNYIGKSETNPVALHFYVEGIGWLDTLVQTLNAGEEVLDIKSVGNCVTVLTNTRTLWLLFKNNTYKLLGDKIPEPQVVFKSGSPVVNYLNFDTSVFPSGTSQNSIEAVFVDRDTFNGYITEDGTVAAISSAYSAGSVTQAFNDFLTYFWGQVNSLNQAARNGKKFPYPVFLVYALKVAGKYVNISSPILVGLPSMDGLSISVEHPSFEAEFSFETHSADIKALAKWAENVEEWGELIESLDIFASTDYRRVQNGVRLESANSEHGTDQSFNVSFKDAKTPEARLNEIGNFYLIESIPAEKITTSWTERQLTPLSQDDLVVRDRLPYNFRSANNPQPETSVMSFNNRLIGAGLRETLTRDYGFFQSCITSEELVSGTVDEFPKYAFRFVIQEADGSLHYVLPKNHYTQSYWFPTRREISEDESTMTVYEPGSLIMYPDSRCIRVDVMKKTSESALPAYYSLPMKKHQTLDAVYFIWDDPEFKLDSALPGFESSNTFTAGSESEFREILSPNKLIQSEIDLPFVYPLSGRQNFSAKITGVATTTIALATSQFGTSDLYVFTEEGIEAQSIDAEGELINHRSVSRDVAIASTICPIDNAIIFSTDRGVMILEQGKVTCISDNMVGKHFVLDDTEGSAGRAILDVLRNPTVGFADFVNTIKDSTPFALFIRNTKAIYDYAGNRLIFFNPNEEYQYVFMLSTATWHKMLRRERVAGEQFTNGLNSYPDAYAVFGSAGAYRIINFSTPLASMQEQDALKAVIITRPLDFDVPDSYKSIEKLFPRGEFERGKIKYLVMASNDGINYHMLNSLRGPSWKYYRLLIISTMGTTDKLSYIDTEINTRFGNKLR